MEEPPLELLMSGGERETLSCNVCMGSVLVCMSYRVYTVVYLSPRIGLTKFRGRNTVI